MEDLKLALQKEMDFLLTLSEVAKNMNQASVSMLYERQWFRLQIILERCEGNPVPDTESKLHKHGVMKSVCKCENSTWNRDAGCMVCDDCGEVI